MPRPPVASSPSPQQRRHPAKYTKGLLPLFHELLSEFTQGDTGSPIRVLDPFGGIGGIHELMGLGNYETFATEIESEWASQHERTIVGDATKLGFADGSMGAVCTSPTYANRMADTYDGRDGSRRHTYRIYLERMPTPGSSAVMQWGDAYRELHENAWREAMRVLGPGGLFVINAKNHIRKKAVVEVCEWHHETAVGMGFEHLANREFSAAGLRHGANGSARVDHEMVMVFRRPS